MILSIDYGKKYLGLAIAPYWPATQEIADDIDLKIAMPYEILENKNGKFLLDSLKKIINEKKIKEVIVGRPLSLSGRITEQTKIIDNFIEILKKEVDIPVIGFDERLTSKMAEKLSVDGKERHAVAAAIILQDYLNRTSPR